MKKKTWIFIALAVCALIVLAYVVPVPLSGTKGPHLVSSVGSSQGAAENNTEIEIVTVQGTVMNDGDTTAKNLSISVVFTDAAHNNVVRKTVKERVDLLPKNELVVEFASEYWREKTVPKTEVTITVEFAWTEDGAVKTATMQQGKVP